MMEAWTTIAWLGIEKFWLGFIDFLPRLILAFVVFVIGWLIAVAIGRIIQEALKRLQLDKLFQIRKWTDVLEKAEFDAKPSEFIGSIIKWILVIVVLSVSVEVLGLPQFSSFLGDVVDWLPNLLAAILIFVATVIIASIAEKLVRAGIRGTKVDYSKLAGTIARWAIWIFGVSAILIQLGIGKSLILVLFQGIVAFLAIAGGLAFGLGGKESAANFLRDVKEKFSK